MRKVKTVYTGFAYIAKESATLTAFWWTLKGRQRSGTSLWREKWEVSGVP